MISTKTLIHLCLKGRIISLFFLCCFSFSGVASPLYPFENPRQEAQWSHLLHDLRCLVCQNQDLADSNATLAKDLRQEVYHLVVTNHSDHEIITYLTDRYGDFILFNPPVKSMTSLLWFGPALLLILGLCMFVRTVKIRE